MRYTPVPGFAQLILPIVASLVVAGIFGAILVLKIDSTPTQTSKITTVQSTPQPTSQLTVQQSNSQPTKTPTTTAKPTRTVNNVSGGSELEDDGESDD